MPTLSMFYGIVIMMYYFDNKQHHLPHIHVRYAEFEAVFSIINSEMIEGKLPQKQRKMVEAWIEIHQDELKANWDLAIEGLKPYSIDPLK